MKRKPRATDSNDLSLQVMAHRINTAVKGVRILLLVLSVVGWTVFAMGMVDVISDLHKHRNDTVLGLTKHHDHHDKDKKKSEAVMAPMWLFLVSGPAIYVLLGLHILVDNVNTRHILHSIIMFLNGFYLFAACGTMLVAMVFVANKEIAETFQKSGKIPGLNERIAKMMLGGVSVAVGFYWLSTFLWPLSELKRRSFISQRELKQMSQEHIVWD